MAFLAQIIWSRNLTYISINGQKKSGIWVKPVDGPSFENDNTVVGECLSNRCNIAPIDKSSTLVVTDLFCTSNAEARPCTSSDSFQFRTDSYSLKSCQQKGWIDRRFSLIWVLFLCVFIKSERRRIRLLAGFTTSNDQWLNYRTIWTASFYSVEQRAKYENANDIPVRSQNFREEQALGLGSGVWSLEFGVWGLGFAVWGSGFRFWVWGLVFVFCGLWFGVWGLWFGFRSLGFGVWGLWFRVWGLGFGVWGLGFGVCGLGFGVWGLRHKERNDPRLAVLVQRYLTSKKTHPPRTLP